MAKRRMFSLDVVDTDLFLDMPQSARLLYYDLGMRADDDGFVDDHKKIMRCTGASADDLKLLIAKCFIIPFNTGICVIRHWRINNYLRGDRYSETQHKEEKRALLTDENNAYLLVDGIPTVDQLGDTLDTQVRLGKDRLELGKDIPPLPPKGKSKSEESFFVCSKILDNSELSVEEKEKLGQWLQHKRERKDKYTETGFKALMTEYKNNVNQFGRDAVFKVVDQSMAGGYAGIVWDKLKNAKPMQERRYEYSEDTL